MGSLYPKGIASSSAKGRKYYYAWRGGPRLEGEPGSPEFIASYVRAHDEHRRPDPARFRALIFDYKNSAAWRGLADSTRRNWSPWLDRIGGHFGELHVAQFDRPEKIRPVIRRWRNRYAATPRAADYGLQVLSRVLAHAVQEGRIAGNPCDGMERLYSGNRADIIWLDEDLRQLKAAATPEIAHAVELAAHTGLRLGDLLRLCWSHVSEQAIVIATGKSRGRREVVIPLYDALRAVLDAIPKRSTTVLTNSRHRPWTKDGFGSSFNKAKKRAGLERDLHFHDLRGTAATRFYVANLSEREIAEILGWDETSVARIIRRYVPRSAATNAMIEKLNRAERRT